MFLNKVAHKEEQTIDNNFNDWNRNSTQGISDYGYQKTWYHDLHNDKDKVLNGTAGFTFLENNLVVQEIIHHWWNGACQNRSKGNSTKT